MFWVCPVVSSQRGFLIRCPNHLNQFLVDAKEQWFYSELLKGDPRHPAKASSSDLILAVTTQSS